MRQKKRGAEADLATRTRRRKESVKLVVIAGEPLFLHYDISKNVLLAIYYGYSLI